MIPTNAAARRAEASRTQDGLEPVVGQARRQGFTGQFRATRVQKDDKEFVELDGYAAVFNTRYTMWDLFGEYDEQVASTALDATLSRTPDVAFLLNHGGMTMARTSAGTLRLEVDETGLHTVAQLNPQRSDVRDLVHAIEDGNVDQMSWAFRITNGRWNDEFTVYTITEADIDRGDVSAVNYGANPYTSISARAQQAFDAIEHLAGAPLEAAALRAAARVAELAGEPEPAKRTGRDAATVRSLLAAGLI